MKKMILFLLWLVSMGASAQFLTDFVPVVETQGGKDIWGKSIDFKKRIRQIANNDSVVFVLACDTTPKGKNTDDGYLYALNVDGLQKIWEKKLNLALSKLYDVTNKGLFFSTTSKATGKSVLTLADSKTGKSIWTQFLYPVYINDTLDIVVGLDKVGSSNAMAYRLHDGELLWNAEIPMTKNVGWENACMVDSTHLLVIGDDINEIDIRTGELCKVKAVTGIHDTKGAALLALTNVLSVAVSVAAQFSFATIYYNLNPYIITGLTSNVLQAGEDVYVSDRKSLYCLGKDGLLVKWKYDFRDREASTARLQLHNGKLLMLNYGYGNSLMRGRVKCGNPFLAVFDTQSGNRERFVPLYDKKHVMNDGALTDDGVFLAGSNQVVYLSFQDSTFVKKEWERKKLGSLDYVLREPFYGIHGDAQKLSLLETTSKRCPMCTDKNKLFVIDNKLNVLDSYEYSEIFSVSFRLEDVICVKNRGVMSDFRLIRPDGTLMGKLKYKPLETILCGKNAIVVYDHQISLCKF